MTLLEAMMIVLNKEINSNLMLMCAVFCMLLPMLMSVDMTKAEAKTVFKWVLRVFGALFVLVAFTTPMMNIAQFLMALSFILGCIYAGGATYFALRPYLPAWAKACKE